MLLKNIAKSFQTTCYLQKSGSIQQPRTSLSESEDNTSNLFNSLPARAVAAPPVAARAVVAGEGVAVVRVVVAVRAARRPYVVATSGICNNM